jgi:tetratricopeptide (TPR) repeat protein
MLRVARIVRMQVLASLGTCVALVGQTTTPSDLAAWRADLRVLAEEVPRRHPAPFVKISRLQWDSAVNSIDRRLPTLSRNQSLVELYRLVALLGDAHTNLQPEPSLGLRYYPLELYSFEDGLFIQRADSAHAGLVGAKVLRIGRVSAEEAVAAAGSIIPHENEWWVRAWAPFWLMSPEMLDGLGLVADAEHLPLVIERNGQVDSTVVAPAGRFRQEHGPAPIDMSRWLTMRGSVVPLWEQHPGEPFWWVYLPERRTLYVSSRAVVPAPRSATNRAQWDQVFALADSASIERLVIDIRENTGGNGDLNRYPVQQILRRPALDRRDRLFVIIGRRTFSAGQQFTNLLEAWTQATLVGEPTGQQTSQYGDHRPLQLPSHLLTVNISSVFHQAPSAFDRRAFIPPAIYTPLTSGDYRRGVDPALAAILTPATTPSAAELVERAIAAGDTTRAEQTLRAAQDAVVNRFRSLEAEVNALGYRLLAEGAMDRAIAAFRVNTRVYPRSANTFDSLGEALLTAGRRDEAIATYRHALEIDPAFPPSVQALERLGVRLH